MSEVHRFLFEGMPVRGVIVRLTDAWTEVLRRRASNAEKGAFAPPVQDLLGQMCAAAVLMQSNIKFNGSMVLQIFGDGPVKLAVVEVQADLGLRATASVAGEICAGASLGQMVNLSNGGRCALTLDTVDRLPGQQPYQGVVPLSNGGVTFKDMSSVVQHYMRQSEQLDTTLVLAASESVAAGLLIQRLPVEGEANLAGQSTHAPCDDNEGYQRIATLASSLTTRELLDLDIDSVLHRLFWQEPLLRMMNDSASRQPHFKCSCSRERVGKMLTGLGEAEASGILAEQGQVGVSCDFCSVQYVFDKVDVAGLFRASPVARAPNSPLQ